MRRRCTPTALLTLFVSAAGLCSAQSMPMPALANGQSDAQWLASYAPDCNPKAQHCGDAGTFLWDPHFNSLIRRSLAQRQSWSVPGHAASGSVLSVAKLYLGITDDRTYFDDNRYLSISGCIAHACTVKGFFWADTGSQPVAVILVAEQQVAIATHEAALENHLWVYTSTDHDSSALPNDFIASLQRWHDSISKEAPSWSPQDFSLITVVARSGRMEDVTYNELLAQAHLSAPTSPGAKP